MSHAAVNGVTPQRALDAPSSLGLRCVSAAANERMKKDPGRGDQPDRGQKVHRLALRRFDLGFVAAKRDVPCKAWTSSVSRAGELRSARKGLRRASRSRGSYWVPEGPVDNCFYLSV
jgi:hypothetical protein